ncbi:MULTISPECIES: hypothetical protein [Paenibacillus]|jgi:hypothetical protein|nr:hypothetical protein [Paenibacillus polymyxa]MBO3286125.1 hypothetical protein [Paenibacillus polymyxa]
MKEIGYGREIEIDRGQTEDNRGRMLALRIALSAIIVPLIALLGDI